MLKTLAIKNFQSHNDSHLEFSPGVNTIIGTSDNGKSSIWRSLDLLINNRPNGSNFVSHWCKNAKGNYNDNTEISLEVDDHVIDRIKGKDNKYILDGEEMTAFGTDVPSPVSDILNIDEINVQHQAHSFFLLNLSSGKVAEELNRLVNLDVIDRTLSNVNSSLRSLKSTQASNKETCDGYSTTLEEYEQLDSMEADVIEVSKLKNQIDDLRQTINEMGDCVNKVQLANIKLSEYKAYDNAEKEISDAILLYRKINADTTTMNELDDIHRDITMISHHPCFSFDDSVQYKIDYLFKEKKELEATIAKREGLHTVVTETKTSKALRDVFINDLKTEEAKYHALIPDACPFCHQSLKGVKV